MIKVIVGLGNPGHQYEKTRHNAGFVFLDKLADIHAVSWSVNSQFQAEFAQAKFGGQAVMLLKPMTFMNRSGASVGKLLRYYKIKPEELLVVHDELELAEGLVKLKRDGGHAGHNGLRDIIAHIDTRDFYRLRIGIGRPQTGMNVADYVLSKPSVASWDLLERLCQDVTARLELLLNGDVDAFNKLPASK